MNLKLSLILYISLIFQERPLSDVVYISQPKKSVQMDWNEHYRYMQSNYKSSPALDVSTKCFNSNGIIITFWDTVLDDDYLRKQVKSLPEIRASILETIEELSMSNNTDKEEIIEVNGIGFFITCTHIGDEYRYNFDSEYRNYKSISGRVVCKKEDRKKAVKIFNDLLKSIKFK